MSAERVDAIVIGAGVVGLAVARALATKGHEVVIIEAAEAIGTQTSSRHSEVIHAGIYYRADSLKAAVCVRGKTMLYEYCQSHQVAHKRCGKLIVATDAQQEGMLASLRERALANGVDDLQWLTQSQVAVLEPALRCTAALLSPSTGIIDSHGLMLAFLGDAQAAGAMLALQSRVTALHMHSDAYEVQALASDAPDTPFHLHAPIVINCAGHDALDLACGLQGDDATPDAAPALPDRAPLAKGNYFRLAARAPCSRLVYPVPEPGGLGVHLTLDLAGQARFGPDVQWVDSFDYSVDPSRAEHFLTAIRRYWPGLPDGKLMPDYAGIRPKVRFGDRIADDFVVNIRRGRGGATLVQLFGIESPGLTSSMALAEHVVAAI